MDPEIYYELHERLCAETDAVIQLTTGGSPRLPVEERLNTVLLSPEMCSLNMGLLNFFIRGEQVFFPNHRSDIERFAHEIAARDVRPELEVYSAAMLEEVEHLLVARDPRAAVRDQLRAPHADAGRDARHAGEPARRGRAAARPRRRRGGPAHQRHLDGPDAAADDDDRDGDGLNVRVGMEDNVLFRRGEPVDDNAQLVERTVRIATELDRRPATPDEARELLALRGRVAGVTPAAA